MPSEMSLRPEWNSLGPPVPCWFRLKLQEFDPSLVLQFLPSWDVLPEEDQRRGMNPDTCPEGAWHIFRLVRPGWVRALAVFSLVDRVGYYVEPTPYVFKLLRYCRALWRARESHLLDQMLEQSINGLKKDRASKSREDLVRRIDERLVSAGRRQFSHKVLVPGGQFS